MTCCPCDERLVELLEERLDRREQADLERHLERCGPCQETLEELTRDRIGLESWRALDDPAHPTTLPRLETPENLAELPIPVVDGYEIFERLGQGGMGVVYRARQHGLDRMVALKMIRAGTHAAPEHLARFRIEARAIARLRHPNVVQIHDVGQADGLPFVALELLEGGSLEARINGTPLPERESAELLATLAKAVAAAHRAGVAHRDLKSANVLFDLDGIPKVADFGLAKRLDQDDGQTHSGQVMGSPSFMAPEQARGQGRDVGPSADIYSLGAILYETVTGRPPFKGASAMETLYQVVHDDPVPPSRLRPGLSSDLETICLKCLAKEPHRRYLGAEDLARDLQRFLDGSPVLARRTSAQERLWMWAKRQPAAAALAGFSLLVALGLSLAGFAILDRQRSRAENRAGLRLEGTVLVDRGQRALREGNWEAGLEKLPQFLGRIQGDPRLADLQDEIQTLIERLDQGIARKKRREQVRADFDRFVRLRHDAQLRDTQFTGVGQVGDLLATRKAARAALEPFAETRPDGEWVPLELPGSLAEPEKREIQNGRYELLLILADALNQTLPGETAADQATQAIQVLEKAPRHHSPTRAYHRLRASCLSQLGDPSAADRERKVADSIPATDAFSHVLQGRESYQARQWQPATAEFEEALRIEPGQFRAQLLLAICQIQEKRPDQARINLTACLQREPEAVCLYILRGFAYGEDAYWKQKEGRESSPKSARLELEAEGLLESAESDFRKALTLRPDDDQRYGLLVNRGTLRIRFRRLDEAVSDLSQAVKLRPQQVAAYITLGQAYRQQGQPDLAIEQFDRGIALKPNLAGLYRSRALARLDRGRTGGDPRELALADLSEAIRLERPGSPEGAADRARRARLLHLAGRQEEALADSEAALRSNPSDSEALLIRIKVLRELKRFAEVVAACDEALARGHRSADLFELRGLARADRGDYAGAIQDYTQALAIDPTRSKPLIHRGWAYIVSEAPRLALHDFDEAVRLAPGDADAYNGRGFARVLHGQHRQAVADAEESIRRGPSDHRTAYNAARIFAKAAEAALAETPRHLGLVQLADDYQERAQSLIRLALERTPSDRRAAFWRDVVQPDPALAAIRQRPKFSHLASQFGRLTQ